MSSSTTSARRAAAQLTWGPRSFVTSLKDPAAPPCCWPTPPARCWRCLSRELVGNADDRDDPEQSLSLFRSLSGDRRPQDLLRRNVGDPVLFLHGNPISSYVWRDVMPAVTAGTGRRCVAIDLLGLGRSDKPDGVKYTLALHRDIVAGAMDALGLEKIVLVAE